MTLHNDIFSIPVGDKLGAGKEDYHLVYSPLAEELMLLSSEQLDELEAAFEGGGSSPDMAETVTELTSYDPLEGRRDQILSTNDFVTLYVLPNYICNFKCSYCFAAHGRDTARLDIGALKNMLDWMLDCNRTQYRKIYVTFLGGGEPMLSYETMQEAILYANKKADESGFEIEWSVVTNGSLIAREQLLFFKAEHVLPRYSFEIIERIQNLQRGNYEAVDASVREACEVGLSPVIRSMITPDNVELLEEMVRITADRYPNVKVLKFDPVTDAEMGADVERFEAFNKKYYAHFMAARTLGIELGIDVQCVVIRNLDTVIRRFCAGEISLNGYGEITACHRVSSPREAHYEEMKYGRATAEGVYIDHDRFKEITSDTVDRKPECADCFLKYNCAGGCWAQNLQYSEEMKAVVCRYNRKMSRDILFERVDDQVRAESGLSLLELVSQGTEKNVNYE